MNDKALLRYSRQIMLPEIDIKGQNRLASATVLILGLGGLGSPAALYLAAAGVGRLILNDRDAVELSNLQRQIAHRDASLGKPKAQSAAAAATALNPLIEAQALDRALSEADLDALLPQVDLALDASDNFAARYRLNEACWRAGKPLVSGAAIRWEGQLTAFDPRDPASPCYRCLYPEGGDDALLNCAANGVIAPLVGVIGAAQAMEAIKLLTGAGEALTGWLLFHDAKRGDWRKLKLPKRPGCPTCGT